MIFRKLLSRLGRKAIAAVDGAEIRRVQTELKRLNGSTEAEFLAIGEKLADFRCAAREIGEALKEMADLFQGEHGTRLTDALAGIPEYSREADAQVARNDEVLAALRSRAAQIRAAFSSMPQMVKGFRTVCALTRIEIARLRDAGADFGDLTAEVQPLAESIQSAGKGVLETCAHLEETVRQTVERTEELRDTQLRGLSRLIAEVRVGLKSFHGARRQEAETSRCQAANSCAVGEALDGVVRAVQFHDITRQQIEHVCEALGSATGRPGTHADSGVVLRLQASQISRAATMFATSTGELVSELTRIGRRVQEMAEASWQLTGGAEGHDGFLLLIEGHFTVILKAVESCTAAQEQIGRLVAPVEDAVARMQARVEEIRGIELRIQRIALNSSIRATHLGRAGDALEVIAGEMHRLAADSSDRMQSAAVTLQAMKSAIQEQARGAREDSGTLARAPAANVRRAVMDMHSASEASYGRLHEISQSSAKLAAEVAGIVRGFSAGARFAAVAGQACEALERLADRCGAPLDLRAAPLEELTARYTMQVERDVHAASTANDGSDRSSEPELVPAGVHSENEFGGNVELF